MEIRKLITPTNIIWLIVLGGVLFLWWNDRTQIEGKNFKELQRAKSDSLHMELAYRAELANIRAELDSKSDELEELNEEVRESIKYIYIEKDEAHSTIDTSGVGHIDHYWTGELTRYELDL